MYKYIKYYYIAFKKLISYRLNIKISIKLLSDDILYILCKDNFEEYA